jgi:hypothetical protein
VGTGLRDAKLRRVHRRRHRRGRDRRRPGSSNKPISAGVLGGEIYDTVRGGGRGGEFGGTPAAPGQDRQRGHLFGRSFTVNGAQPGRTNSPPTRAARRGVTYRIDFTLCPRVRRKRAELLSFA